MMNVRHDKASRSQHKNTAFQPGVIDTLRTLAPASGMAHSQWIVPYSVLAAADQPLRFVVGWGYEFPVDGKLPGERLEEAAQRSHEGEKEALEVLPGAKQKAIPAPSRTLLTVKLVSSYFSRTYESAKRASREAYPDAMRCNKSHNNARALVTTYPGQDQAIEPAGVVLEIIPLETPAQVAPGDSLAVQVLWFVRLYQIEISVMSAKRDQTDDGPFRCKIPTDLNGQAAIELSQPGPWLLDGKKTTTYSDESICEVNTFYSTMTFEVSE